MAKVKCPRCFYVNPDGLEHCVQCNTALPKIKIEAIQASPRPMVQPDLQLRRGQVLANRYTVLNLVGRGGMGCIYKVHDNILGEDVALKTLLPQFVQDKLVVERFFNEARIARRLAHGNIVRVHDIGSADNIVYISMEFLQGKSLRAILEGLPPGQRLPIRQTLRVIDELCAALEYAHQYTVHRDIKPENVMIGMDGSVKLMDFGISKLMDNTRLTGASVVMGTPFYMSPEQIRNSRDVDARSDIYSVGVLLYEILTGNVPTGVPRPASQIMKDVPQALDAIIASCVDPEPEKRYQSAADLRAALRPIVELVDGVPHAASTKRPAKRPAASWPLRKAAGVLLAVGLLAGLMAGMYGLEAQRKARLASERDAASSLADPASPQGRFDRYKALVPQLRPRAEQRAKASEEAKALFDEAEQRWDEARVKARVPGEDAVAAAEQAVQYYLAAILLRDGMRFVPAGQVTIGDAARDVAPFLIDATETTIEQFRAFCQGVPNGWRFPQELNDIQDPAVPVTMVTFFDAQACAAWQGKLLPTDAEWARAAYGAPGASAAFPWGDAWIEDASASLGAARNETPSPVGSFDKDLSWSKCYDMAGNVAEWTRTVSGGDPHAQPDFGAALLIRGGHFQNSAVPLSTAETRSYETREPTLASAA